MESIGDQLFTAHDFASRPPPPPESTETLIRRFNEYKLETEFHNGYVVHRTGEWAKSGSSKVWKESTWKRKERIGFGAFGTVWLQEKEGEEGRELRAVKMISRDILAEADGSQELLALVKLKGYNYLFVDFLGWYEDLDFTFLAMEYIEHGDLGRYIKKPMIKDEVKEIARQILEGLEVLHSKEIYHRDLKPQNILMASLDPIWVKIADFGVSKRAKNTSVRTQVGTLGYLAPELLGLLPRQFRARFVPHALDIWSLGSLLHELLTFETPFMDHTLEEYDPESGLPTEAPSEFETDMMSLQGYCCGRIEFPTDVLQQSQLSEEGVSFIKSLLIANPKNRPTAARARQNPWLIGYASDSVENLKNEFLCLGVDLDFGKENILMRQADRDITRLFPSSAKKSVSSLLLEAAVKGYDLAFSRLLESPSCNSESLDKSEKGKLFQLAIGARKFDLIKLLLQKKMDIEAWIGGEPVLQWAVRVGHVDMVELLLWDLTDVTVGIRSRSRSRTFIANLLVLATKSGNSDMVKVFLRKKAKLDDPDRGGQTALQAAAEGGYINIVKLLLHNEANVNAYAEWGAGRTALQAATKGGHIEIVRLLLNNKADVNAASTAGGGRTALQIAAGSGNIDIVRLFLDTNVYVNANSMRRSGRTALQAAAEGGYIDIVKLLLDNGADVNAEAAAYRGRTALQAAAQSGHIDVVKLLLDKKANVNSEAAAHGGRTALQAAAQRGHIDIVKLLLDNKADVDAEAMEQKGRTALQAAAQSGHIQIVRLLLDNNANVNAYAARDNGRTALQAAAESGNVDIVKLLLDNKADMNASACFGEGRTALQAAAESGHLDIVRLLLDKKADVNASAGFNRGRTALQAAAESGNLGMVRLLLDKKADVNAPAGFNRGRTALQVAAGSGYFDMVGLLLDQKADVNASAGFDKGRTALQAAAESGHFNIVRLLLDKKADVNAPATGYSGRTALQAAAESGHIAIVKLLLENKAHFFASISPHGGGITPLEAAQKSGNTDVIKLFNKIARGPPSH